MPRPLGPRHGAGASLVPRSDTPLQSCDGLAPKPAFVAVGARVSEGQTVLIIEAMKTMNAIPAPRAGTVKEISVENGAPVEFGQTLLVLG